MVGMSEAHVRTLARLVEREVREDGAVVTTRAGAIWPSYEYPHSPGTRMDFARWMKADRKEILIFLDADRDYLRWTEHRSILQREIDRLERLAEARDVYAVYYDDQEGKSEAPWKRFYIDPVGEVACALLVPRRG